MGDYVAVDRDKLLGVRYLAGLGAEVVSSAPGDAPLSSLRAAERARMALAALVQAVEDMPAIDLIITAVTAAPVPAPDEIGHNRREAARAAGVPVGWDSTATPDPGDRYTLDAIGPDPQ